MHVVVIHDISDPEPFFKAAQETEIPDGMSLQSLLPSGDGSRCVCVWEAGSENAVRELVEGTVGELSSNRYFEVDASNAQGLPA